MSTEQILGLNMRWALYSGSLALGRIFEVAWEESNLAFETDAACLSTCGSA